MHQRTGAGSHKSRLGDVPALVRLVSNLPPSPQFGIEQTTARKRNMVAQLCRLVEAQLAGVPMPQAPAATPPSNVRLAPRVRQTLERLLAGDSEKQIASHLGLSRNTVHCYVKSLYRRYRVCSRGELLARFVHSSSH
jgi:DNA-binding NarL/FixJ family response regulator